MNPMSCRDCSTGCVTACEQGAFAALVQFAIKRPPRAGEIRVPKAVQKRRRPVPKTTKQRGPKS